MLQKERRDSGQNDLFGARLDQIVDMKHALARLGRAIDWRFLEERCGAVYTDAPGHPPLPTRLMAGLAILKSMHDLSDEALCKRWVENPYYQLFCGEEFFRHDLPFDRSSMTRWRQRMGEEKLNALLQESLASAVRTGAAKPVDFTAAIADTTDARLMHRSRERLVRLANTLGIELRQSYARVGKIALIKHQRYAHAKQFKRAGKALRTLKTYLGRVIRDMVRKAKDDAELEAAVAHELMLARRVHAGNRNLNRVKGLPKDADLRVFSLHASEVECIGKGKAHKPYESASRSPSPQRSTDRKAASSSPTFRHCPANPMTVTRSKPSYRPSRLRSGQRFPVSSPMPVTKATTLRKLIASRFIPQARNAG